LNFQILSRTPVQMAKGLKIDYRLRLLVFPMKWQSEITEWNPPGRFVDAQTKGPYKEWRHEHTFEEREHGTLIKDRVRYRVPGWILEPMIHMLFVRPQLVHIFDFRAKCISEIFA